MMTRKEIRQISKAGVLLFAAVTLGTSCSAAAPSPRDEVLIVLRSVQDAIVRGDSPTAIATMQYAPNVVIVGEGDKEPERGLKAAASALDAFVTSLGPNGQKSCRNELAEPTVASANTYASFLLIHCGANPPARPDPIDVRCLYVWQKLPQGWRVVLEQWGVGTF
jgi:hypothetical protein